MSSEPSLDSTDARTYIANLENEFSGELAGRKRMIELANGDRALAQTRIDRGGIKGKGAPPPVSMGKMMAYVSAAFVLLIALGFGAAYGVIWVAGVGEPSTT